MTSRWDKYLTATLAVAMTSGFCFVVLEPQKRRLSALRTSIAAIEGQLAQRRAEVGELPEIDAKLKTADALLADFQTRIPADAELGDFVEDVSAIAERLGLGNRNIVPLTPQRQGAVTALPIRISFEAGFPAIFDFLRELERMPRVARVSELIVERARVGDEAVGGDEESLRTELVAQIFYRAPAPGQQT